MKTLCAVLCLVSLVSADTVIMRDGSSFSGRYNGSVIAFAGSDGVKFQFPTHDVQSIAFGTGTDTVTLRNGKSYSGQFTGPTPIGFQGSEGIKYDFPTTDLDAIVFNSAGTMPAPAADALVIPIGADIVVRTNENIDSESSYQGQTYSASIVEDVTDTAGSVAIPAGSAAKLLIRKISTGGAVHSAELVLDLFSVKVGNKEYRVVSSTVDETNRKGLGANRRTAEMLGGGSALGALMGGIFGGGKGAGVGALAGAGGGFLTQVFTRGQKVKIPAESTLRFRLEKTLQLAP